MTVFAGPAPAAPQPRRGALRSGLPLAPGLRVGLLGGSFNPAHEGHLHVAETALARLGLDRVVWLVSPQNPLKSARDTTPLAERMAGVRALVGRDPRMLVSDFESRIASAYTVDTLRTLKARHPGVKFVWLMGSDNLAHFHRWKGWRDIAGLVPMAVVSRPGALILSRTAPAARRLAPARVPLARARLLPDMEPPAWVFIRARLNPVSSTQLRARRMTADAARARVPAA